VDHLGRKAREGQKKGLKELFPGKKKNKERANAVNAKGEHAWGGGGEKKKG